MISKQIFTVVVLQDSHQALRLAIARALVKINPEDKTALRSEGFMTRDSRSVERKKPVSPKHVVDSSSVNVNIGLLELVKKR